MEFVSAPGASASPFISDAYGQCIQSLGLFVKALREPDCLVAFLRLVDVPDIVDEYGRAKIWGNQTNANLPARARGSLDDKLRHDADLKSEVLEILLRLTVISEQAAASAIRKHNPTLGSDQGSITSVSADSDSDGDEDSDDDRGLGTSSPVQRDNVFAPGIGVDDTFNATDIVMEEADGPRDAGTRPGRTPRICMLVQQLKAQIRLLFDVSSLLRRPGATVNHLRPISPKSGLDSGQLAGIPLKKDLDGEYVKEKVLQWRRLVESGPKAPDFDTSSMDATTAKNDLAFDPIESIAWLCQRLAYANTRRREQLEYWKSDLYKGVSNPSEVEPILNQASIVQSSISQVTTNQVVPTKRALPTTDFSKSSKSYNTNEADRPRTAYAPTALGLYLGHDFPDPPIWDDGVATLPCLYCGVVLEKKKMQKTRAWWRHVFDDLSPYVCTFKDCINGDKLYTSRDDWIYHELLIHRRRFVCCEAGCGEVYETRSGIEEHLQHDHYTGEHCVSSDELAITVDLCDRPVDFSRSVRGQKCVLCQEPIEHLKILYSHLAAHMEDIALFALPPNDANVDGEKGAPSVSLQGATKVQAVPDASSISLFQLWHHYAQVRDRSYYLSLREEENPALQREDSNIDSKNSQKTGQLIPIGAFRFSKAKFGEDDPDIWKSRRKQTRNFLPDWLKETEKLQIQKLETNRKTFGDGHPETLISAASLAKTYCRQQRFARAKGILIRGCKGKEED